VAQQTEEVYDDQFWTSLNGVCTALDNVDARLYVDARCVYYQKPLVDSGTLGTKGNTQVVVPYQSESYGSSRDPPEESIPICTLKNFPNKIEHTIQWARDAFEGYFKQAADEVNGYLTSPTYLADNAKQANTTLQNLRTILSYLVKDRPVSYDDCIRWARLNFEEEYNNKIQQMLYNFPADSVTKEGMPFWSGTKRAPTPLLFDVSDPLHLDYIISSANLRAFNYALPVSTDINHITSVITSVIFHYSPIHQRRQWHSLMYRCHMAVDARTKIQSSS
jgi:ubiquitin-activating enzyme E1